MNMFSQFGDSSNTPEINPDRQLGRDAMSGEYMVVFARCQHVLPVKGYVLAQMGRYEMITFINKLQCRECEREFQSMESQLHSEYVRFIQNGGKL